MSKSLRKLEPKEAHNEKRPPKRQPVIHQEGDIGGADQASSDTGDHSVSGGGGNP